MTQTAALAVAFLVLTGTVLPACTSAPKLTERRRTEADATRPMREAAAVELAAGLMARFVDDRWTMPDADEPVACGADMYRWELEERPARDFADSRGPVLEAERAGNTHLGERLRRVEVRVWLAEASGGSASFDERVPHAGVMRVVDPLAFPDRDAVETLLDSPGGVDRLMELMTRIDAERPAGESR